MCDELSSNVQVYWCITKLSVLIGWIRSLTTWRMFYKVVFVLWCH